MNSNASTPDALFWARAGEMLHNGIVLPPEWPPKPNHHSGEPMPAPYLEHPPEIIPIDVGRQLLMDDFLIDETTLERTFHAADYHPANPVLRPDRRWETAGKSNVPYPYSGGAVGGAEAVVDGSEAFRYGIGG